MSVSDPLIKDIKECTLRLFNESTIETEKITDSSQNLQNLCQTLEKIFYKGLIEHQGLFYVGKKNEAYTWMSSLPIDGSDLANFNYKNCVEEVKNCKSVNTNLGKFRLLMRHCLARNCLHLPLNSLVRSSKAKFVYGKNSIIGDEILSAILLSVLLQCDRIPFQLHLCNSYFLDITWEIPDLVKLEVVPCRSLGLSISFSENKAIIVHVTPGSVASESGEISKGDVLADLNGVEINSSRKGRLNNILRQSRGRPVNLVIIKAYRKQSGDVFSPLKTFLRNLQIDSTQIGCIQSNRSERNDSCLSESLIAKDAKTGYKGTYLGSINVGSNGSVRQIGDAIKRCIRTHNKDEKRSVIFDIGEMNIKISDARTNGIIFIHSYMQISSCGSVPNLENYLGYIAEEKNCSSPMNFVCYVFCANNGEDARAILQGIGQGFYATHFAV